MTLDTLPLSTWRTLAVLAAMTDRDVLVDLEDGAGLYVELVADWRRPNRPVGIHPVTPADLAALTDRGWVEIVEVGGEPRRVNVTQTGRYWSEKHQKRRGR